MIYFGPYPVGSPEADELYDMDKALVSAVEMADVALRLAALKGLREPDVAGAVDLLRNTWRARNDLTPLKCAGMELVHGMKPFTVAAWRVVTPADKRFPGAELILEPNKFPVPFDDALKAVSAEYNRKRRIQFYIRMHNASREEMGLAWEDDFEVPAEYETPTEFWSLARDLAPHCPRFAHLYNKPETRNVPRRRLKSEKSRKFKKSS